MSVDMQVQMRRNVDEMHASVNDLTSWASEIAKRDRSLRGMGEPDQAAKQAQALAAEEEEEEREIAAAKEELRRLYGEDQLSADGVPPPDATGGAPASGGVPKPKGIGQKYDKWNNYDAEGVIKQLEEREADKERLRLEVARLENRRAQAQVRKKHEADAAAAEALKLAGNEAFAAARYEEATEKYTSALDLAPRSAVLYANRGLALLKLGGTPTWGIKPLERGPGLGEATEGRRRARPAGVVLVLAAPDQRRLPAQLICREPAAHSGRRGRGGLRRGAHARAQLCQGADAPRAGAPLALQLRRRARGRRGGARGRAEERGRAQDDARVPPAARDREPRVRRSGGSTSPA